MNNLKNNLILVTLLFGIPFLSNAQSSKKEAVILSAGYGLPNLDALINSALFIRDNQYSSVGPIHAKIEVKATKVLGIGLSLNYFNYKATTTYESFLYNDDPTPYSFKKTSLKINIRTNIHYVQTDRFDLYAGFGLGYGISSSETTEYNEYTNSTTTETLKNPFPMGFEVTQGVRMKLTQNLGMYAEVGMAQSFIQLGGYYKFHNSGNN